MKYRSATLWTLCAALAVAGCGRRAVVVAPTASDGFSAAEPAPQPAKEESAPFQFPDDAGGKLLAKVLPPTEVKGPLDGPNAGPRRFAPSAALDAPPLALPPSLALPPQPAAGRAHKPPAPHLAVDETLGLNRDDPLPPEPRSFATAGRIRLPSVDPDQPAPLPILARPATDREPLDDPTVEASAEAALAAAMPQRTKEVPYFRVTLPDPYENRRPLSLAAPADDGGVRAGTVHPPQP